MWYGAEGRAAPTGRAEPEERSVRPVLPRTGRSSCSSDPVPTDPVGPDALTDADATRASRGDSGVRGSARGRALPVGELHDRLEPAFGELVEHADDAVELFDGEVLEGDAAHEVHVAVGAEREPRAVHRVVALQQEFVELAMVLGRQREEVHLVAQRALVQVEVDRGGVAALAREAHVPAAQRRVVLDGLDVRLRRDRTLEVGRDERVRLFEGYLHLTGARAVRSS